MNRWKLVHNNIYLLDNPNRFVPFALNIGIKQSSGDPIIRLDAHTEYDQNYIIHILETFENTHADIVGGAMHPVGKTIFQKAVAFATTNIFGIGGSKIHDINFSGYSDHVYLGAWKRNLFEEIGYFDIRFKRNQDDEFDYRANKQGKKVYLSSKIKSYYYPRKDILLLFKQYFQYGLYKPLVLKKIPSEIKFRHVVPSLFCLYLVLFFIFFFSKIILFVPLLFYIILDILFSFINKEKHIIKFVLLLTYPVIHISYGLGFIFGFGYLRKKYIVK